MNKNEKPYSTDPFFEILGWLRIVISPTLLGVIVGGIYYLTYPTQNGKIIGILISIVGLIIGIIWATRVFKKYGTIWFLSRLIATDDIKDEETKDLLEKKY